MDFKICEHAQKHPGKTVIAHVSDLHFSASTRHDDKLCAALVDDISAHKVDLIAVTGDVVDNSIGDALGNGGVRRCYESVKDFLLKLCEEAEIDPNHGLLVVPGNHDFRRSGFLGFRRRQFDLFYELFGSYSNARLYPNLGLATFCFNSNSEDRSLNFGNGRVSEEDLVAFSRSVRKCRQDLPTQWAACRTRIALVHHHPMPIPATEHRETLIDHEWFIVFKNAGMFLREMIEHEVDVVLHGHKHCHAYSRASFPTDIGTERTISVAAAGSVGKAEPRPPSYNFISIDDSGEIALQRRTRVAATYQPEHPIALLSYEQIRRNRSIQLAKQLGIEVSVDRATVVYRVTPRSGDCIMRHELEGVRCVGEPTREIEIPLRTSAGRFAHIEAGSKNTAQNVTWKCRESTSNAAERTVVLTFDPPIGSNRIDYHREVRIFNAFCFNQRDRRDSSAENKKTEHVTLMGRQTTDCLHFVLHFPPEHMPKGISFSVKDEKGVEHRRERDFALPGLSMSHPDHTVTLQIRNPLPGYRYIMQWDLPLDDAEESQLGAFDASRAEALVQHLLALRKDIAVPPSERVGVQALHRLKQSLTASAVWGRLAKDATFDTALFGYDEQQRGLVCCSSLNKHDPNSALWKWVIAPGTTINGRAYRRREPVLWFRLPRITVAEDAIYETSSSGGQEDVPKHTVILSIPLFYPLQSGRVVGVLTYSTRSVDSELLRLLDDKALLAAVVEHSFAWYSADLAMTLIGTAVPMGISRRA